MDSLKKITAYNLIGLIVILALWLVLIVVISMIVFIFEFACHSMFIISEFMYDFSLKMTNKVFLDEHGFTVIVASAFFLSITIFIKSREKQ